MVICAVEQPKPKGRVVLVTPKSFSIDSRSIRQVRSLMDQGYTLKVLEGPASAEKLDGAYEIKSLWPAHQQYSTPQNQKKPDLDYDQSISSSERAFKSETISRFKKTWLGQKIRDLVICIIESPLGVVLDGVACMKITWRYCNHYIWRPRKEVPRADLYIVHSYEFIPMICLLGAFRRIPVVYDAHDFYENIHSELKTEKLVADRWWYLIIKCTQRLAFRYASAITTVSDGLAVEYARVYCRWPIVIRSTHDSRDEFPVESDVRSEVLAADDDFLIVVIGDNRPGQAIEQALEALCGLNPNFKIAFIGHGYEKWEARKAEFNLDGRVFYLGPIPSRSMVPFIKTASISMILDFPLTLNYLNSLPNRFFHSIAAELPLLYPGLPEMASIASTYDLGIQIDPQDPNSISEALLSLETSPELLDRYRLNAKRAAKVLNWMEEEKIFLDIIDKVMAGQVIDGSVSSTANEPRNK